MALPPVSRKMTGAVSIIILLMFGIVLFMPLINPSVKIDADAKQTLFVLVTAVVFLYVREQPSASTPP